MAKGNAIVMYLEQARIHGEQIGVTRSEVLFTKPNGYLHQHPVSSGFCMG